MSDLERLTRDTLAQIGAAADAAALDAVRINVLGKKGALTALL
ncbi:MAG: phenylalanine--tRNA ligase subunit alpha, partial [Gammaproteobacteria bacterium]|nr:phenylalanine--tRNA ligase subunit alpha [Gammaproteobacteria bacterium]